MKEKDEAGQAWVITLKLSFHVLTGFLTPLQRTVKKVNDKNNLPSWASHLSYHICVQTDTVLKERMIRIIFLKCSNIFPTLIESFCADSLLIRSSGPISTVHN